MIIDDIIRGIDEQGNIVAGLVLDKILIDSTTYYLCKIRTEQEQNTNVVRIHASTISYIYPINTSLEELK